MNRKDYILIAAALKSAYTYSSEKPNDSVIDVAVNKLCERLLADNPRFDRARFLAACGVQS